ncbi:MAG: hypothetical protein RSB10_04580 [Clostridia bacterium]
MTKKKILTLVVVVALLVASISTMLLGCKPKPKPVPPADYFQAIDKVVDAFGKGIGADARIDDFTLNAGIDLKVNETLYNLRATADIDLKDSNQNYNNSLGLQLKKGNEEIFTISYAEHKPVAAKFPVTGAKPESDLAYGDLNNHVVDNILFIKAKSAKADGGYTKLAVKMPSIKAILKAKAAEQGLKADTLVNGEWVNGQVVKADIPGILKMLKVAVDADTVKMSDSAVSFELPLTKLLGDPDKLGSVIANVITPVMLKELGIDIDPTKLTSYLPEIAIKFNFTFKADGSIDKTNLDLKLGKKLIDIKHTDKTDFVKIDITKDINIGISAFFDVNKAITPIKVGQADMKAAKAISLLNITGKGELNFEKGLNIPKDKLGNILGVNIPDNSSYDFNMAIDYDPAVLLDIRNQENGSYNTNETKMFYWDESGVKQDLYQWSYVDKDSNTTKTIKVSKAQYDAVVADGKATVEPHGLVYTRTLDFGKLRPQILAGFTDGVLSIKDKSGVKDLINIELARDKNGTLKFNKLYALGLHLDAGAGVEGLMTMVGGLIAPKPDQYAKYGSNPEVDNDANGVPIPPKAPTDPAPVDPNAPKPLTQMEKIGVYIKAIMVSLVGGELSVQAGSETSPMKVAAGAPGQTIDDVNFNIVAGIKLNKAGLTINAHLFNGGTAVAEKDLINTKFSLNISKFGYGGAPSWFIR